MKLYIQPEPKKPTEILICNHCKEYWIAPVDACDCGCKTLSHTHYSNIVHAKNNSINSGIPVEYKSKNIILYAHG